MLLSPLSKSKFPGTAFHETAGQLTCYSIDGVLYRGSEAIQGAAKALRMLRRNGHRYVFLTNGGGVYEDRKAKSLRKKLKLTEEDDVIGDRLIQSHTPMKGWPEHIKKKDTILITGHFPHWARKIAKRYGPSPCSYLKWCMNLNMTAADCSQLWFREHRHAYRYRDGAEPHLPFPIAPFFEGPGQVE